ncbi:MAG TPA: hypothetical protein VK582_01720 [Pyrinomonadaceae bacterium]|nr:hypothetical protein [Pyrinomonadaceae bacterium]
MQITDLNKIVNLFLVGSLALTIVALLWIDKIQAYYLAHHVAEMESTLPTSMVVLVTTLLALGSAMFTGCVVDGLTEIFLRANLRRLVDIRLVRKFFWVGKQYQTTKSCRDKFNSLLENNARYKSFHDDDKGHKTFAAALFFHTAQSGNVSWLVQHHAVHVLTADYIFLVLTFTIVFPILHFLGFFAGFDVKLLPFPWWCLLILSLYPLCHLAIDRWLYTYEIAYRHGMVVLSEAANPGLAPGAISIAPASQAH